MMDGEWVNHGTHAFMNHGVSLGDWYGNRSHLARTSEVSTVNSRHADAPLLLSIAH